MTEATRLLTNPRRVGFLLCLIETWFVCGVMQALAMLLAKIVAPWPELLAFLAEHGLWLYAAWRLSPDAGPNWWRILRLPLFGIFLGSGFGAIAHGLALFIHPARSFFSFAALGLPNPTQLSPLALSAFTFGTGLRFIFAYAYRAVWLEGRVSLRWRLTALALGGGLLASSLVAVLPNVATIIRNPDGGQGEALRRAHDLAAASASALLVGDPSRLVGEANPDQHKLLSIAIDSVDENLKTGLDVPPKNKRRTPTLAVLDEAGHVIASNQPERLPSEQLLRLPYWTDLRNAARAGRCATSNYSNANLNNATESINNISLATCPINTEAGMMLALAIGNNTANIGFADLTARIALDLTRTLDILSQAFLPLFLVLGWFGYLTARRLTIPLERLLTNARNLQQGNTLQLKIPGKDEVARLAEEFNLLAERLSNNMTALEKEKAGAEKLLAKNRRLSADAGHELRTPLAIMRAQLERSEMRGETLSPDELNRLSAELSRLEKLVNDLLSGAESERPNDLKIEAVNASEIANRVAEAIRPLAQSHQVSVSTAAPTNLPQVKADHERLFRALFNLAHNAVRYTPEGGMVRIECKRVANELQIAIMDTGIGIAVDDLQRIFEPFYRTDPARSRTTGGSGLGLAIVKEAIEAMHGRIQASSRVGHGSVFTISLPIETN